MNMFNKILWFLDKEIHPKNFERLCVDLLFLNGYRDIVPFGGMHDHGRDAEIILKGIDDLGEIAFFQFSLQKTWKRKLREELEKVKKYGHDISRFILITSRDVSGTEKDNLKFEVLDKYGWKLEIFPREWLRLQLEEANPHIAQKYIGIEIPEKTQKFHSSFYSKVEFQSESHSAWFHYIKGDYERAVVELKRYLSHNSDCKEALKALAWSEYQLFRYNEALLSINKALKIENDDNESLEIRACVLAEYGISNNDRASLLEAEGIFQRQAVDANTWTTFYNYANVLSALGKYDEAIEQYKKALIYNSNQPEIWKNLGSAYHNVGNHDKEIKCFDKALKIDPRHPIVLMSKGCTLLIDFGRSAEGADLVERALQIDPSLSLRWPHVWYWLCEAYIKMNDLEKALSWAEEGLLHSPSHRGLRKQKAEILNKLCSQDANYLSKTIEYYEFLLQLEPHNYNLRENMANLYCAQKEERKAWEILQDSFEILDINMTSLLIDSGFSIQECIRALRFLPEYNVYRFNNPISNYWSLLDESVNDNSLVDPRFEDELFVFAAIPFGLGYAEIASMPLEKRDKNLLLSFFDIVHSGLKNCFRKASEIFAAEISQNQDKEIQIEKLSLVLSFLPMVGLLELSRQNGWIPGRFGIENETVLSAIDEYSPEKIMGEVAEMSLIQINNITKMFPNTHNSSL